MTINDELTDTGFNIYYWPDEWMACEALEDVEVVKEEKPRDPMMELVASYYQDLADFYRELQKEKGFRE